jgi:hypothetical protein
MFNGLWRQQQQQQHLEIHTIEFSLTRLNSQLAVVVPMGDISMQLPTYLTNLSGWQAFHNDVEDYVCCTYSFCPLAAARHTWCHFFGFPVMIRKLSRLLSRH